MVTDIIIILFIIASLLRGRELGLARQAGSMVGFIGGLLLGAWLQPHVVGLASTTQSRALLTLITVVGSAIALLSAGEYVGARLKGWLARGGPTDLADGWLGAGAGVVTVLVTVWLVTPVLRTLPFPDVQQSVRNSRIVRHLDASLPAAPGVIASLERLINPNGFPQVFIGLEPEPSHDAPLPDLGQLNKAVQTVRPAIVKIEGKGCGGIVEGSGFVARSEGMNDLVVTNAHVVAGVNTPFVIDQGGNHLARLIWFDPDLDVAVLRTNSLRGTALSINTSQAAHGTPGAVLGYPGGGGFTAKPASVLQAFTATGRNIYGQGRTARAVYELKADIISGNSGGPVIDQQGRVIGLVFAQSTTYDQVGYALQMKAVASELNQASGRTAAVSSGQCAEE